MKTRLPFSPRHLALLPLSLLMVLPLVWMFITSIETLPETRHFPPHLIPSGIHWRNYPDALDAAPFGRFFLNSFGYFSQPFYWRADYGYRGDWQTRRIVLYVDRQENAGLAAARGAGSLRSTSQSTRDAGNAFLIAATAGIA